LYLGRFCGTRCFAVSLRCLFFRTGFISASRTSNASNCIEPTGFALKKAVPLAARTIVGLSLHN